MAINYSVDPQKSIQRLMRKMDAMEKDLDEAVKEAVSAAGDVIVEKQKQLCPVRTGKLKSKIHKAKIEEKGKHTYACQCGFNFKKDPDILGAAVSAEYGRVGGVNDKGQKIEPQRATPFIRPGADAAADEAARRMEEVFFREVGLND